MKRILSFISLLLCVFVLSSCYFSDGNGGVIGVGSESITVTFVVDGTKTTRSFTGSITYPEVPQKEGYIFNGWFYDEEGTKPALIGTTSSSSLTLYACWIYDYNSAIDTIFADKIRAAVGISVEHKKQGFFNPATSKVTGSGVIFKEDADYYYILTNNHVTAEMAGYSTRIISVIDCFGTEHQASFIAGDAAYDLALVKIAKGDTPLLALEFAEGDADIGDIVFAIGQPNGIKNSVTIGKMRKLDMISGEDADGNLDFSVIWHDAEMDHGSSGGVLINKDFKIVGINYAVGTEKDGDAFICGFAIPLSKLNEFIEKY